MTPTRLTALCFFAFCTAACADREAEPDTGGDPAAPFFGQATPDARPIPPLLPPRPVEASAAFPDDDAARRREIWATSRFRCRAISTTRLRTCRFVATPTGLSITFPVADITCDEVVFDAAGDPAQLRGCRGKWLRVPSTVSLQRSRAGDVWSGSHSGWRWPGDGETYCCPGLWIEAPPSLRGT
jgi:hypothetical protein